MKPEVLIISGWGPYKDKIEIDFTQFGNHGLFLISGPTGAGKTTIFDAISYALFGEVSGSMRSKDGVRSDFASPDTKTYVNLTMTHGARRYVIERNPQYDRPKKRKTGESSFTKESENAILYLPDDKTVEGNREVNGKIQEILGMDFEQFKQLSMIAQGEFARLLTANSKEKTQIFRKIFSTYKYELFSMNLSQKAKELYGKIMTYHNKMDETVEVILPVLQGYVSGEDWETFQEDESVYKKQYDRMMEYLVQARKACKEQEKVADLDMEKAEGELLSWEKKMQQATATNQLFEEYEKSRKEQERLQGMQSQIEEDQKTLNFARNAEKLEGAFVFREESRSHLKSLQEKIRQLEKEITELEVLKQSYHQQYEQKESLKDVLLEMVSFLELAQQQQSKQEILEKKQKELTHQQQVFLRLEQTVDEMKKKYEDMERAMRYAMAGILAEQLTDGEPCPVCGSMAHPHLATLADSVPRDAQIQVCKEQYEKQNQQLMALHGKASTLHGEVRIADEELQRISIDLREEIEHISTTSDIIIDLLNTLGINQGKSITQVTSLIDALQQRKLTPVDCKITLEQLEDHCNKMQQILADEKAKKQMLEQLDGEEKEQQKQVRKAEKAFDAELKKAGFLEEEQYLHCKMTAQEILRLQKKIDTYAQNKKSNDDYVNRMEKTLKGKEKVAMEELLFSRKEAENKKKQMGQQQRQIQVHAAQLKAAASSLKEKLMEVGELEQSYGIIKDLDNLTMGNNGKRLVFEQYVLISYFEEVLHAANSRLQKMTAGRYLLSRVEGVSDGRTKDNFELQVLDHYTGKYRLARTLSGGESFKASLALALGMSDIIQATSGGVRVETLFIDEGFGSLDSESLDMACETLLSLVDKERLIGIISHVSELQERIPKQLVVTKTNEGSNVHVVV